MVLYMSTDFIMCQCLIVCSSTTSGSGQQCCYGDNGLLLVGPPGGGTVDLVSPDVSLSGHFVSDVVPYLLCCKAGIFSDCNRYYEHRPSDMRALTPPPPPGQFHTTQWGAEGGVGYLCLVQQGKHAQDN